MMSNRYAPPGAEKLATELIALAQGDLLIGVPNQEYHSLPGFSSSQLKHLAESVNTYLWHKKHPKERTSAMVKGSALHDCILLPDVYDRDYKVGPTKTKTSKAWKEFAKENPGVDLLTPDEANDIAEMSCAAFDNPTIRKVIETAKHKEVSLWTRDQVTHFLCKVRPDVVGADDYIYDIKTTRTPGFYGFRHSIWQYSYHVSAAFYVDMANAAGLHAKGFRFLCIGNHPPYNTAIYELDSAWMAEGRRAYQEGLQNLFQFETDRDAWAGIHHGREIKILNMEYVEEGSDAEE